MSNFWGAVQLLRWQKSFLYIKTSKIKKTLEKLIKIKNIIDKY